MAVFVAEIGGRAIVAFDAENDDEANARLADREFRKDLLVLQNEGRALWDGVSEIHMRPAREPESTAWQAGRVVARLSDERDYSRAFLIRVTDPTSFDDDDDDDYDNDPD